MIIRPKCTCLDCKSYSLVYSSMLDVHKCLECHFSANSSSVVKVVEAFSIFRKESIILPDYSSISCIACNLSGGINFRDSIMDVVGCTLCYCTIPIYQLCDLVFNTYKTKLIEEIYNHKFSISGAI